jgi:hypothetical protein
MLLVNLAKVLAGQTLLRAMSCLQSAVPVEAEGAFWAASDFFESNKRTEAGIASAQTNRT